LAGFFLFGPSPSLPGWVFSKGFPVKKTFWLAGAISVAALSVAYAQTSTDPLAPAGAPAKPPAAATQPVTGTLFGQQVTDNYRYMEQMDADTTAWMKSQGAYTRAVMDSVAPLADLQKRVAAFTGSFGLTQSYSSYGGREFYEERAPGAQNFDVL